MQAEPKWNPDNFQFLLLRHYVQGTEKERDDYFLCKLKLHALQSFYDELTNHFEPNAFRTGYCIAILKFFRMIDPKQDPYWLDDTCLKLINYWSFLI